MICHAYGEWCSRLAYVRTHATARAFSTSPLPRMLLQTGRVNLLFWSMVQSLGSVQIETTDKQTGPLTCHGTLPAAPLQIRNTPSHPECLMIVIAIHGPQIRDHFTKCYCRDAINREASAKTKSSSQPYPRLSRSRYLLQQMICLLKALWGRKFQT